MYARADSVLRRTSVLGAEELPVKVHVSVVHIFDTVYGYGPGTRMDTYPPLTHSSLSLA